MIPYTPGPWVSHWDNDTGENDEGYWEFFTISGPSGDKVATVESEADARLIAAAPDILEACRFLAGMETWHDLDDPEFKDERASGFAKVHAAIAKAEGKP